MTHSITTNRPKHTLKAVDMGINTHQEPVAYMREDCHVCHAEGFGAHSRIRLTNGNHFIIASLNIVDKTVLAKECIGLSKIAMQRLQATPGETIAISHIKVVKSLTAVRKKIYGNNLTRKDIQGIITDISSHRYSDIEIASFLSACAGNRLNIEEIIDLTQAMVSTGKHLNWNHRKNIFDKHCIGGLPGNRTTPIVVPIMASAGHTMPKTSSRAITSPAGTADTMEVLSNVNLQLADIQKVVKKTGACLTWGGAVNLSPADDLLIRIERALDLDGEGQLIASVLSKKIAAGSTHAIIDIPVGNTAKVRSYPDAERLSDLFTQVGEACGIHIRCIVTDGSKPVGQGIGPVEEARDVLTVLQNHPDAPVDLRKRALLLTSHLLDMAENCGLKASLQKATKLLDNGSAYQKFQNIITAQGETKQLPDARYRHAECAEKEGLICAIDNRKLARLAKLAGAPFSPSAGLRLHATVGHHVNPSTPLFTLFSDSHGEQNYALEYYDNEDIFIIEEQN